MAGCRARKPQASASPCRKRRERPSYRAASIPVEWIVVAPRRRIAHRRSAAARPVSESRVNRPQPILGTAHGRSHRRPRIRSDRRTAPGLQFRGLRRVLVFGRGHNPDRNAVWIELCLLQRPRPARGHLIGSPIRENRSLTGADWLNGENPSKRRGKERPDDRNVGQSTEHEFHALGTRAPARCSVPAQNCRGLSEGRARQRFERSGHVARQVDIIGVELANRDAGREIELAQIRPDQIRTCRQLEEIAPVG